MSGPFVSSYDEAFLAAFGRGIKELPADKTKIVKDIVDKIHEEVVSHIEYYVQGEMASNAADHIRYEAAKICSSMLADALAGDDKTIRDLFGFSEWYTKHGYIGSGATQWKLIDAIVARRPDIFLDERLAQRDREIADLQREVKRIKEYNHRLLHPDDAT
jgi:hypothetical protein